MVDRATVDEIARAHRYAPADHATVLPKLGEALSLMVDRDTMLLQSSAAERAICHRLAVHLEAVVNAGCQDDDPWHVDCEYNLSGLDLRKHLDVRGMTEEDGVASSHRVYPDLVVHRRSTDDNLLVVEVKVLRDTTKRANVEFDFRKLVAFQEQGKGFEYQHAAFVLVVPSPTPELISYAPTDTVQ